jgi:hypothetical protein
VEKCLPSSLLPQPAMTSSNRLRHLEAELHVTRQQIVNARIDRRLSSLNLEVIDLQIRELTEREAALMRAIAPARPANRGRSR